MYFSLFGFCSLAEQTIMLQQVKFVIHITFLISHFPLSASRTLLVHSPVVREFGFHSSAPYQLASMHPVSYTLCISLIHSLLLCSSKIRVSFACTATSFHVTHSISFCHAIHRCASFTCHVSEFLPPYWIFVKGLSGVYRLGLGDLLLVCFIVCFLSLQNVSRLCTGFSRTFTVQIEKH